MTSPEPSAPIDDHDERSALVAGLTGYEPPDEQQAAIRREMLAFVDRHPDALHRTCVDGHFTASALVVDHEHRRVLVLLHRKLRRWLQPGGHADGQGDTAAGALREATEETGIAGLEVAPGIVDLDIHEVRPPGEPVHLHLDVRHLVLAPPGAIPSGNHESLGLRWALPEELGALGADEGLVRLARRGLERAAAPG
ncbi:MAG: NUDIX hydrolase [Acidimicrobiales bacterium]|nr:NUDIX hydrolase [Acidimicrobiales bacterium]